MQSISSNKLNQIEENNLIQDYQFYQEKKFLVLDVDRQIKIESIDLPKYCLKCGQSISHLTEKSLINLSVPPIKVLFLILAFISMFAIAIVVFMLFDLHNGWWFSLIGAFLFIIIFVNKYKEGAIKLNYGLCDSHQIKERKRQKAIWRSGWIFIACFLIWALLYFLGISDFTLGTYSVNTDTALLVVFVLTAFYPFNLWSPLITYKQSVINKEKERFYLAGCGKDFLSQFPKLDEFPTFKEK